MEIGTQLNDGGDVFGISYLNSHYERKAVYGVIQCIATFLIIINLLFTNYFYKY